MNWQPPEELRISRPVPRAAIFFALLGSVLAGLAVVERNFLFAAIPLFVFAILAWVMRPKASTLVFDANGIMHRQSGVHVAYRDITYLLLLKRVVFNAKAADKASEMLVGHPRGCLRLPWYAPVSRLELYMFLRDQSRLLEPPARFPGRLREVYEQEIADFGPVQVLASAGRATAPLEIPSTRPFFLVFLVALAAVIAAAALSADEGIVAAFGFIAGFTLFLNLLLFAVSRGQRSALGKLRAACGIVISPRGLTMETPALKGALGWAELKGITEVNRGNALVSGLLLKIEGGQILVGDHFTCPLTEIHRRIEANLAHERR